LDMTTLRRQPRPVTIEHTHVLGRTRSGKSKGILGWVLQAILNGVGVAVVDPHGDLYKELLSNLALAAVKVLELADRIVNFNPLDSQWSVGFNPLQLWPGEVLERKALFLADVITKIFHDDPAVVLRMRRIMKNSFMALMELGLTLLELPRFLADREFREALLAHTSPRVREFWFTRFPANEREADVWVASTLNRLEPLIDDPDFRLIFGQQSTINLRTIMDEEKVLLVNTSRGELMDDNSRLLGAFVVAQIQQAAMTRAELSVDQRRLFWLVLDEFQTYVSASISTLLEESGKYKLALLLAHQHLGQLEDERLRASILSQCINKVYFGLGEDDARFLVGKVFRPNLDQVKHVQVKPANWGNDEIVAYEDITWRPLFEILELERRKLDLEPRYFWHKRQGCEPRLYRTFDLPDLHTPPALIRKLVDRSGARFAIPKSEARRLVEVERPKLLDRLRSAIPASVVNGDAPRFWGG
jgi:hypothetical protein